MKANRNYYQGFFILLLIFQMWCYNYNHTVLIPPRSVHCWRQLDCLSFAVNFYNGRGTLSQPCVNNLGATDNGRNVGEFPIIQYFVAMIWKLTGVTPVAYRVIGLFFLFWGFTFIYRLMLYWTKDNYAVSMIYTGLVFTSPILSYYGIGLLSDIQAFGLACGGFYHFIKWFDQGKKKNLTFSVLFFLCAGLLKMSSAVVYLICLLLLVISKAWPQLNREEGKGFYLNAKSILFMLMPFGAWLVWYSYAWLYNHKYGNGFFLVGIMPIWDSDAEDKLRVFHGLARNILPRIFPSILSFTIIASALFLIVRKKMTEKFILIPICFLFLILFFIFFFGAMDVHDYYLINMTFLVVICIGVLLKTLNDQYPRIIQSKSFFILSSILLLYFTYSTSLKTRGLMDYNDKWVKDNFLLTKDEKEYFAWNTYDDRLKFEEMESKSFRIEELGVAQKDTILCIGDGTLNRALLHFNRLGWTDWNYGPNKVNELIDQKKKIGLKYIVVIDPSRLNDETVRPFLLNKVGEKGNISVYKL